jgi:hypothetical protein
MGDYNYHNKPKHYNCAKVSIEMEAIDILHMFFPSNPYLWNAGKYMLRAGSKPKEPVTKDLMKALYYINFSIGRMGYGDVGISSVCKNTPVSTDNPEIDKVFNTMIERPLAASDLLYTLLLDYYLVSKEEVAEKTIRK